MGQNRIDDAIDIFKFNIEMYLNSTNVYDSLGEGYENNDQYELAKKNYLIAIEKAEANSDPYLQYFKDHLQRVQQSMGE